MQFWLYRHLLTDLTYWLQQEQFFKLLDSYLQKNVTFEEFSIQWCHLRSSCCTNTIPWTSVESLLESLELESFDITQVAGFAENVEDLFFHSEYLDDDLDQLFETTGIAWKQLLEKYQELKNEGYLENEIQQRFEKVGIDFEQLMKESQRLEDEFRVYAQQTWLNLQAYP